MTLERLNLPSGSSDAPPTPPPIPPPPAEGPTRGVVGRIAAIAGIVTGFLLWIVPGIFSLRSYRRWTRGEIARPTFAWATGATFVVLLVASLVAGYALFRMPLVDDDFSDQASGWPIRSGPYSGGYVDGGYEVGVASGEAGDLGLFGVVWDEGSRPNVAVEGNVELPSQGLAGVGCADSRTGEGFLFLVGADGSFQIRQGVAERSVVVAEGAVAEALGSGPSDGTVRVRGECRAGYGDHEARLFVDGSLVATQPVEGGAFGFDAITLATFTSDGSAVTAHFDDALAIGIEPSSD